VYCHFCHSDRKITNFSGADVPPECKQAQNLERMLIEQQMLQQEKYLENHRPQPQQQQQQQQPQVCVCTRARACVCMSACAHLCEYLYLVCVCVCVNVCEMDVRTRVCAHLSERFLRVCV